MARGRGEPQSTSSDIGPRVREEIARKRLSRQAVADAAKISLSTLDKALAGRRPFTLATLVRLETVLGVTLRNSAPVHGPDASRTAVDELGGYARATVSWLEGSYLTIRPSFGDPKAVYAYRTDISWDDAASRLTFREAERTDSDYTQFGSVAVPHQSGHIYLVTNRHGQHRLVILSRPTITDEMHGLLTTLIAGRGSHLSPIATPIVLKKIVDGSSPAFGALGITHRDYSDYARLLRRTIGGHYAAIVGLP
jgi:transcriptional regulator with XRE-family HTH domain